MSIPNCRIYGTIDNTTNPLNKPIRGFIRIDQCEEEIRSLEVRLMRAEFIPEGRKYTDNLFKDTSEIQNLQICDGDIIKDLEVPIHMFLPRNFSCSSLKIDEVPFQIGFELHIIIVFKNNYVILEKIPLKLWRSK
uniref:Down syndrome critical region protein 3 homolog [Metaseiulus occidentalis] n=2 Tax=Lepeophtheirus salmonis TaxID=72036 RepID=A0A0K2V8B7_LEPSM